MEKTLRSSNPTSEKASSPITLEDLLKIKKAEQPDAAFWAHFDRSLKKAQGQASITPLYLRLIDGATEVWNNVWPHYGLTVAALMTIGLFVSTIQKNHITPQVAASLTQLMADAPAHFVNDDLSRWQSSTSLNNLYAFTDSSTAYNNENLEIIAMGNTPRSFAF